MGGTDHHTISQKIFHSLECLSPPSPRSFFFLILEDLISQFCGEDLEISQQGMKYDSPTFGSSPSEEAYKSVCGSIFDSLYFLTGAR